LLRALRVFVVKV